MNLEPAQRKKMSSRRRFLSFLFFSCLPFFPSRLSLSRLLGVNLTWPDWYSRASESHRAMPSVFKTRFNSTSISTLTLRVLLTCNAIQCNATFYDLTWRGSIDQTSSRSPSQPIFNREYPRGRQRQPHHKLKTIRKRRKAITFPSIPLSSCPVLVRLLLSSYIPTTSFVFVFISHLCFYLTPSN